MNRLKRSSYIFVLIVSAVLLLSCGQAPPQNSTNGSKVEPRTNGSRGGALNYRLTAAPKTFNYVMMADEPSLVVAMFMLTSRLVDFDHTTQKFVPGLAESWSTQDGLTYDLTLREGLKFS